MIDSTLREVYAVRMIDVEDPELFAVEPLLAWEKSESGKWVMSHAIEVPQWSCSVDSIGYGYILTIKANLTDKDYTYWKLRFE